MARRKKTKKTRKIDKRRLRKQYGENFDVFEQVSFQVLVHYVLRKCLSCIIPRKITLV